MKLWLVLALGMLACEGESTVIADLGATLDSSSPDMAMPDVSIDSQLLDAEQPDALTPDAAPPFFSSRPAPPPTTDLTAPRDWRLARGLIHIHSVYSHDACDGDPRPDGHPNEPCLARFRAAMCHNHIDYILLTDHPGTFAEIPFVDGLLHRGDDQYIEVDGRPIANQINCENGHQVLLTAGSEGDLTPVMLREHAADRGAYRDMSPEGVAALKVAGALVFQVHIERYTADMLRPLNLDGIEYYNIHTNLDPGGMLPEILPDLLELFQARHEGPHPDLAFLRIYRENPLTLTAWEQLQRERRILGFAGSDIHENLPRILGPLDGERIDSYRRVSSWFSNYIMVHELTVDTIREALTEGRLYTVFEALGSASGFDFHLRRADGTVLEMGAELPFEEGLTLIVEPPEAPESDALNVQIIQVTADGRRIAAEGPGRLEFTIETPGAYRVIVTRTPESLRPELGTFAEILIQPHRWLQTNPIYIR